MKAILNGQYQDLNSPLAYTSSSQLKAWHLDDQRTLHASEILQAHKNGKANPAFVRQYPEESKRFFTQQQINEAINHYD
jgi:aspartyl/asparaginyl-tRNA synthetase